MGLIDGSLKMDHSDFKYSDFHVFVRDTIYKSNHGLWEMFTLANPVNRQRPHYTLTTGRAAALAASSAISIYVFPVGPKLSKEQQLISHSRPHFTT
jgi:hypothetical protein